MLLFVLIHPENLIHIGLELLYTVLNV